MVNKPAPYTVPDQDTDLWSCGVRIEPDDHERFPLSAGTTSEREIIAARPLVQPTPYWSSPASRAAMREAFAGLPPDVRRIRLGRMDHGSLPLLVVCGGEGGRPHVGAVSRRRHLPLSHWGITRPSLCRSTGLLSEHVHMNRRTTNGTRIAG